MFQLYNSSYSILSIKDVMKVITGHPFIASEAKFATALKCSITYYNMNLFQSLKDSLE